MSKLLNNNDVQEYYTDYIKKYNNDIDEAVIYASDRGHLELVKLLLANDANIHAKNDEALSYASRSDHLDVDKWLVANNATIHANTGDALS